MAQYEIRTCAVCRMEFNPTPEGDRIYCRFICRKWAPLVRKPLLEGIQFDESQLLTICKDCGNVIVTEKVRMTKRCSVCLEERIARYGAAYRKKIEDAQ